ncbi:MAG: DUF1592 domain-containing protein [Acidobacteriota bacterium]
MRPLLAIVFPALLAAAPPSPTADEEFQHSIRPTLVEHCSKCHNPTNLRSRNGFLRTESAAGMESMRGVWRNVAVQLQNRTMPPSSDSKISEDDRLRVAQWITKRLQETACSADLGEYAGTVTLRRLNRREYHNNIRDLLGVDLPITDLFPADGTGGEGFDTNGETLFTPAMLMERYLDAAAQILDRAIVAPELNRSFTAQRLDPPTTDNAGRRDVAPGAEVSTQIEVYADGEYDVRLSVERYTDGPRSMNVKVDGVDAGTITVVRYQSGGPTARNQRVRLTRGTHTIAIQALKETIGIYALTIAQRHVEPPAEQKALHYRLLHIEPGEQPVDPRRSTRRILADILPKAFRRPVTEAEIDRFLTMYDRAAERGDPYEERVKLALKTVLVSPAFLFHMEQSTDSPKIQPLNSYEIASRLSYFLWSTMPDDELLQLAARNALLDPKVIAAQVDRMLDDSRSRTFANSFVGQWLGTKDVGGRVAPTITETQAYYNPDVAADLREEPVLFFHHILGENRSLIDLLDADYTFLTDRLVTFYDLARQIKDPPGTSFQKVQWPDNRRAGIFGLGSVLAMTSNFKATNPVVRGAWVLETVFGTTVPPPPPDVPPLEKAFDKHEKLTMRQKLARHRENPTCAACHNLMDPIGFALENYDWLGRWRDTDSGLPIDASAKLPTGETFNGPVEFRKVLLGRKDEFIAHFTGKMLGYALGRSLLDPDQCTIQRITNALKADNYRARTLIREIALSIPFRNTQGPVAGVEPPPQIKKRAKEKTFK